MGTPLKIGVACGGTGGHIFPGLATAEVLRRNGHDIVLWLAGKDVEKEAVAGWQGPRHTVKAEGFEHGLSVKSVGTVFKLRRAYRNCRRLMREDNPDVVLAMGSYASVGPVASALKLGIPVVLHEANVYPGRAIKFFSKRATAVAGSFEESRHYLRKVDLVVTGMPIRPELEEAAMLARQSEPVHEPFTFLVMGGSRGSRSLNDMVSRALVGLRGLRSDFRVVHLSGREDEERMQARYTASQVDAVVQPFTTNMSSHYLAASMAICRAGAATCAELTAFAMPSLLVPYPYAVHDHQTANGEAMEKAGSADLVAERDLDVQWLTEYLDGCINTTDRLDRMRKAALKRIQERPAKLLADLVERVGRREPIQVG